MARNAGVLNSIKQALSYNAHVGDSSVDSEDSMCTDSDLSSIEESSESSSGSD